MSYKVTRREMLLHTAGAAGAMAGWGLAGALGAAPKADRSARAPTRPVAIERCESYEPAVVRGRLDRALRCESYEPAVVRGRLDRALDAIGGIGTLVAGKTVTVKLNLTGRFRTMHGRPAWETYHVHPNVVAALAAALEGAGARRIVLCDALYYTKTAEEVLGEAGWDLSAIRSAGTR